MLLGYLLTAETLTVLLAFRFIALLYASRNFFKIKDFLLLLLLEFMFKTLYLVVKVNYFEVILLNKYCQYFSVNLLFFFVFSLTYHVFHADFLPQYGGMCHPYCVL